MTNKFELSATLQELSSLKHTPAGVPAVEFKLAHSANGTQQDADLLISAVAFGLVAEGLAGQMLGKPIKAAGFLRHRKSNKALVFQVERFEVL